MNDELLTVDAAALRAALTRMTSLARDTSARAVFELQPDRVVIDWSGATEELPADGGGGGACVVSVPAAVLKGLARTLPTAGRVRVGREGARLRVHTLSFKCERLERRPRQVLATNASQRDVLLLRYRELAEAIEEAGLTAEVDHARERALEAVGKAAQALSWLGIDEALLGSWVDAHLQAVARGEPSFSLGETRTPVLDAREQPQRLTDRDR